MMNSFYENMLVRSVRGRTASIFLTVDMAFRVAVGVALLLLTASTTASSNFTGMN